MKAVFQRVSHASVTVDGEVVGAVAAGVLLLVGVQQEDTAAEAAVLAQKVANLRVFRDESGKMNRSVLDIGGGVLAVSQFTLCADIRHGRRPDFFAAARPETALPLFETVVSELKKAGVAEVQTGVFGADMQVELLNDGPVTILLDTEEWKKK